MRGSSSLGPSRVHDTTWHGLLILLFFGCALVCVCLPRFNRREVVPSHWLPDSRARTASAAGDAAHYVAYVKHFRGEEPEHGLKPPFTYRPLAPFVAARLPMAPMTALNVLNIAALLLSLTLLDMTIVALRLGLRQRIIAAALFTFSFPLFYYGAVGYIDPVAVACVCAGGFLIVRRRYVGLACVLVIGALAKETTLLLLPAAVAQVLLDSGRPQRKAMLAIGLTACALTPVLLVRHWAPGESGYLWTPSLTTLAMNASRPRAWASILLTFGLPGMLSVGKLPAALRQRTPSSPSTMAALSVGCLAAIGLTLYSLFAASADGRFMWLLYPFAIPLAVANTPRSILRDS
jgi:hypothetical protein